MCREAEVASLPLCTLLCELLPLCPYHALGPKYPPQRLSRKTLHPTSTDRHTVLYPCCLQSSTSCRFICLHYPVLHVPWKTVSSSKTTYLVSLDKSILYCLNIVTVISVHITSSTSSLRPFPFAVSH